MSDLKVGFLLDTNVISELVKPRPDQKVVGWVDAAEEDDLFISVITLGELHRGVALLPDGNRKLTLQAWLNADLPARFEGRIIDVTAAVAEDWGALTAEARRKGMAVDIADALLASSARVTGHILVTRNLRDFRRFGLSIVNPFDQSDNKKLP